MSIDVNALFKKHGKLLSFIGAFIVFATFVIKENLEDDFKDQLSEMENARSFFVVRGQISQISSEIIRVQNDLSAVVWGTAGDGDDAAAMRRLLQEGRHRVQTMSSQVWALQSVLNNARVLRPMSPESTKRVRDLRDRLDDLARILREPPWKDAAGARLLEASSGADVLAAYLQPLEKQIEDIDKSLRDFADESVKMQSERIERYESRLAAAKYASIALYVLGWGLGLLAKMARSDIDGAD